MPFLAGWAKRLSWKDVATVFQTSWGKVYRSIGWIVAWGLSHRDLSGVTAIGVDEILWQKGHKYLTVVYQIDRHCKRLLWVGKDRTVKSLLRFFRAFGKARSKGLCFVCSGLWKPYLKVIAKKASQALHVLDRFHIAMQMNKAIDEVRATEVRQAEARRLEPILAHARRCPLKRPSNLSENQKEKLADLLRYNLRTIRSYLLTEDFPFFWEYVSLWVGQGNFWR